VTLVLDDHDLDRIAAFACCLDGRTRRRERKERVERGKEDDPRGHIHLAREIGEACDADGTVDRLGTEHRESRRGRGAERVADESHPRWIERHVLRQFLEELRQHVRTDSERDRGWAHDRDTPLASEIEQPPSTVAIEEEVLVAARTVERDDKRERSLAFDPLTSDPLAFGDVLPYGKFGPEHADDPPSIACTRVRSLARLDEIEFFRNGCGEVDRLRETIGALPAIEGPERELVARLQGGEGRWIDVGPLGDARDPLAERRAERDGILREGVEPTDRSIAGVGHAREHVDRARRERWIDGDGERRRGGIVGRSRPERIGQDHDLPRSLAEHDVRGRRAAGQALERDCADLDRLDVGSSRNPRCDDEPVAGEIGPLEPSDCVARFTLEIALDGCETRQRAIEAPGEEIAGQRIKGLVHHAARGRILGYRRHSALEAEVRRGEVASIGGGWRRGSRVDEHEVRRERKDSGDNDAPRSRSCDE